MLWLPRWPGRDSTIWRYSRHGVHWIHSALWVHGRMSTGLLPFFAVWALRRIERAQEWAVAICSRPSQRERQVLQLLCEGLTNSEIGQRLFVTTKTVEHHVGRVLAKLGVRSRGQAAALCERATSRISATTLG